MIVCVLSTLLVTGSALAQTPPPAQQTPPLTQAQTPPAQTPPAQAQPEPAPRPFPQGAKIAYVNIQLVASNSAQGKAYAARIRSCSGRRTTSWPPSRRSCRPRSRSSSRARP